MLAVDLGVQERDLDGLADPVDLRAEAADVLERDVRDLFEQHLVHLGQLDPPQRPFDAGVHGDGVPVAQLDALQRGGAPHHALLVCRAGQDEAAVGQRLLDAQQLAGSGARGDADDRAGLVQQHLGAGDEAGGVEQRGDRHAQPPAVLHHVRSPAHHGPGLYALLGLTRGVDGLEGGEGERRMRDGVQVLLERGDLGARGLEQLDHAPVVAGGRLGLGLGLPAALAEARGVPLGRVELVPQPLGLGLGLPQQLTGLAEPALELLRSPCASWSTGASPSVLVLLLDASTVRVHAALGGT